MEKKLDLHLPDPLKTTKNQPTLVVTHQICMPSLNAADIGRSRNPACMQKLCRGRLHKVTSGVKLLLFLGVVVYISRTHGSCDLKGGEGEEKSLLV